MVSSCYIKYILDRTFDDEEEDILNLDDSDDDNIGNENDSD